MSDWRVETGDCREVMAAMADNSVDAIVTDPPYELGFMSKAWDRSGIAYDPAVWTQALRVLKPGGHLIAFGGSRTYHRMACAVEDAGFEVRDQILWLYGSGFPKSLNVSKAIDAHLGAEREVVGVERRYNEASGIVSAGRESRVLIDRQITAPATPEAQQFDGWGTAAKPAHEPAVLARKPLIGTVAANVLAWGTGGINIAGCRIGDDLRFNAAATSNKDTFCASPGSGVDYIGLDVIGRWPANLIHDGSDEVLALFPDRQGKNKTGKKVNTSTCLGQKISKDVYGGGRKEAETFVYEGSGSAARYFYTAKASRDDRDDGLDGFDVATGAERACRKEGSAGAKNPRSGATGKARNTHPTVKPTDLMRYLCRLVTPPGGLILDPFCGSGSTGRAALLEGFRFVGIELLEDHARIARARIKCIADRGVQLQLTADAV